MEIPKKSSFSQQFWGSSIVISYPFLWFLIHLGIPLLPGTQRYILCCPSKLRVVFERIWWSPSCSLSGNPFSFKRSLILLYQPLLLILTRSTSSLSSSPQKSLHSSTKMLDHPHVLWILHPILPKPTSFILSMSPSRCVENFLSRLAWFLLPLYYRHVHLLFQNNKSNLLSKLSMISS